MNTGYTAMALRSSTITPFMNTTDAEGHDTASVTGDGRKMKQFLLRTLRAPHKSCPNKYQLQQHLYRHEDMLEKAANAAPNSYRIYEE